MYRTLGNPLVALMLVVVVLSSAGCGPQPSAPANQSANANVVATANSDSQKSAPAARASEGECDLSDIETRREKVQLKIEEKIKDKDSPTGLAKQYEEKAFILETEVYKVNPLSKGYLVVYVAGMVHGSDELKELANILNDFYKEKGGCVSRVAFVSRQALKSGNHRRTDPGLEWTYCPFDSKPCSDGSCGCRRKKPYDLAPMWDKADDESTTPANSAPTSPQ
ncbi:MAG: hypothetical protein ABL984_04245 [Pyrinomonadaceae bacterium]